MNSEELTVAELNGAADTAASAELAAVESELAAQVPQDFAITDQQSANWVLRKIAAARSYARDVQEWAHAESVRAQREEQFFLWRFGAQLEAFARAEIEQLRGRKSLKLPAGTIGFRAQPLRVHIQDEAQALEWARKNCPAAVRLTIEMPTLDAESLRVWREWFASEVPDARVLERLSKTELNRHFETTGEMPDGGALDGGSDKFYVK
jgi:hypothetical protein